MRFHAGYKVSAYPAIFRSVHYHFEKQEEYELFVEHRQAFRRKLEDEMRALNLIPIDVEMWSDMSLYRSIVGDNIDVDIDGKRIRDLRMTESYVNIVGGII